MFQNSSLNRIELQKFGKWSSHDFFSHRHTHINVYIFMYTYVLIYDVWIMNKTLFANQS